MNINFTTEGKLIDGYITPKQPYLFLNSLGNESTLIFPNKSILFKTQMIKTEDFTQIDSMAEIGKKVAQLIGFFGTMLTAILGISIITGSGGGSAVKMLRLFKVIYR